MIGISITDLIPESFYTLAYNNFSRGLITSIISFIIGAILIKFFIVLINKQKQNQASLYKLGILNMLALMLHNFPEDCIQYVSH